MSKIRILTKLNGKTVLDCEAKKTSTIENIVEIAQCEVSDGYADYALVTVDGKPHFECRK